VILLHDFSFRSPEEILADLIRVPAPPAGSGSMSMAGSSTSGMAQAAWPRRHGSSGMKPDLNDVDYDAFLANGRTLEDPEVLAVDKGGRVRLRLINGAASTNFTIDTGALAATLIAVDGHGVKPVQARRFPSRWRQRLDLLVELPPEGGAFPILALQEGTTARTGVILASPGAPVRRAWPQAGPAAGPVLDLRLEASLIPTQGLGERKADRRFVVKLEAILQRYAGNFDGVPYPRHPRCPLKRARGSSSPTRTHDDVAPHATCTAIPISGGHRRPAIQARWRRHVLVPPKETVDVIFDATIPANGDCMPPALPHDRRHVPWSCITRVSAKPKSPTHRNTLSRLRG